MGWFIPGAILVFVVGLAGLVTLKIWIFIHMLLG